MTDTGLYLLSFAIKQVSLNSQNFSGDPREGETVAEDADGNGRGREDEGHGRGVQQADDVS